MSLGEEADTSGELHDDGLPLGAEAVMESDHETSFEADIEDGDAQNEKDDPNDRDFRLYDRSTSSKSKRLPRLSDMSGDAAADGTISVDPAAPVKRKRGRPSRASLLSAAGKVPGSDIVKVKKKRGRPAQDIYTPEVIEQMRATNLDLDLDLAEHQHKMPKISALLDRQTRKSLPPEMLKALHRARNTQLQRERRDRMRMQRAMDAASSGGGGGGGVVKEEPTDKLFPDEPEEVRKRGRKSKRRERGEEDLETGSGSAILERAKGKVSEWIKTISSEAETSVEPDDLNQPDADARSRSSGLRHRADSPASSTKQRGSKGATPPAAPATATAVDTNIDPRLVEGENDDDLVQGYFSRFGTVTGAANKDVARTNEVDTDGKQNAEDKTYEAGIVGDEYYFSN
uniref:Uncharacterized protein n=2 Tax=Kalmanozyma brasiliensis (strain GHG001) TaxID=1365824 RepID=V5EVS6_KALBG